MDMIEAMEKYEKIMGGNIKNVSLPYICIFLDGYEKGHNDGYEKGHNDGYSDGYNVGYNDGYDDAEEVYSCKGV